MTRKNISCSFCSKKEGEVQQLVASSIGTQVYICEECIDLCNELLEDKRSSSTATDEISLPQELKNTLDEYVIGQENSKKVLSVAVYNHYKRIMLKDKREDVKLQKSNVLLVGPTGVGKTLMVQTMADTLNVPLAITDATTLTEAGYVGDDVENILNRLLQAADFDHQKAEKGIIYIDEFDKITRKNETPSLTRDVSGEGVQQALLKIIEGTIANVPPTGGRKHPQQENIHFDTSDVLFICGGSFDGLENIVTARLGNSGIGFSANIHSKASVSRNEMLKNLSPGDLVRYGIIPECVGRLQVVSVLDELITDDLVKILVEPVNSIIKQYQKLFEFDNVSLEFENDALEAIAKEAKQQGTGARGLKRIVEEILLDPMYDAPSWAGGYKCIVTLDSVVNREKPEVIPIKKSA